MVFDVIWPLSQGIGTGYLQRRPNRLECGFILETEVCTSVISRLLRSWLTFNSQTDPALRHYFDRSSYPILTPWRVRKASISSNVSQYGLRVSASPPVAMTRGAGTAHSFLIRRTRPSME